MSRLHRLARVDSVVLRAIESVTGCRTGRATGLLIGPTPSVEIPLRWANRLRQRNADVLITLVHVGGDQATQAKIDTAIQSGLPLQVIKTDHASAPMPSGFDLAVSLHAMHQLDDRLAFRVLQNLAASSSGPLIVCDYARSRANGWMAKLAAKMISRDPLVTAAVTGRLSAAYTINEFKQLAESALARPVAVEAPCPGHFLMTCDEVMAVEPLPAFA